MYFFLYMDGYDPGFYAIETKLNLNNTQVFRKQRYDEISRKNCNLKSRNFLRAHS